jgi:RNA polymerase sigma factor (sigma-70 family)
MADGRAKTVIRYIRELSAPADGEDAGDAQFLERFITGRDEVAYEAIVRRHGPMVLGTCLRVLNNLHDAEDAFQATFLILARKARSIGRPESLGGWLYRIAYRAALRAKTETSRRQARQSPLEDVPTSDSVPDLAWFELRPVLDEELNRLPRRYRDAVVLCYFQNRTYAEAARALGLAEGTVSSRLARARDLLRKRLTRRGLTLSSGLLVTLLSQKALTAAMPVAWRDSLKAALPFAAGKAVAGAVSGPVALLTEGVLQAMFLSRLRRVAVVLLTLALLGTGAGVLAHQVSPGKEANAQKENPPATAAGLRQDQPQSKAIANTPPQPVQKYAAAPGYRWVVEPRSGRGDAWSVGRRDGKGVAAIEEKDKDGALVLTLAHAATRATYDDTRRRLGLVEFRPVAFDGRGQRHLWSVLVGGVGTGEVVLNRFRLDPKTLPADKVERVGVEMLAPEGIELIVRQAVARAKKEGVEVLPPPKVGQNYDFVLTTLDGRKVRSADLKGKVVLLDCWSTT